MDRKRQEGINLIMSKKYKELAPTISSLISKDEMKIKKDKISNESSLNVSFVNDSPTLSKEVVELALDYIRWMGVASIPGQYKKFYNNGPQDIASKVCEKLGQRAISEDQVRMLYNEWKMVEYSDLEDPVEETPIVEESIIEPAPEEVAVLSKIQEK